MDKAWKRWERVCSSILSEVFKRPLRRNPLSGRNSGHNTSSDIIRGDGLETPLFFECKKRQKGFTGLDKFVEAVVRDAKEEGKLGSLLLKTSKYGLFICRLKDLPFIFKEE